MAYCRSSLSSRRAWIETPPIWRVALRSQKSLSSRRAWIETSDVMKKSPWKSVALLAEGVD